MTKEKHEEVMIHIEEAIKEDMKFGYTRQETINTLDDKNADRSIFIELLF